MSYRSDKRLCFLGFCIPCIGFYSTPGSKPRCQGRIARAKGRSEKEQYSCRMRPREWRQERGRGRKYLSFKQRYFEDLGFRNVRGGGEQWRGNLSIRWFCSFRIRLRLCLFFIMVVLRATGIRRCLGARHEGNSEWVSSCSPFSSSSFCMLADSPRAGLPPVFPHSSLSVCFSFFAEFIYVCVTAKDSQVR